MTVEIPAKGPTVLHLSEESFERKREYDRLQPGLYAVSSPNYDPPTHYGYSPDGIGVVWYDSYEDMLADRPAE